MRSAGDTVQRSGPASEGRRVTPRLDVARGGPECAAVEQWRFGDGSAGSGPPKPPSGGPGVGQWSAPGERRQALRRWD